MATGAALELLPHHTGLRRLSPVSVTTEGRFFPLASDPVQFGGSKWQSSGTGIFSRCSERSGGNRSRSGYRGVREDRVTESPDSRGGSSTQFGEGDGARKKFGDGRFSSYKDDRRQPRDYGRRENFPARSGGYRGSNRYPGSGYRREKKKEMHPGAREILDEASGERVIVWGVEGRDAPKPSQSELQWEQAKVVASGVVSDESWYKAVEASMDGPLGAYSVRGVRQGKGYGTKEDEWGEEDSLDEGVLDEDEDFDSDDSDGDQDVDEEEEDEFVDANRSIVPRPPRVKVFGRDFGGKVQGKGSVAQLPSSSSNDATGHAAAEFRHEPTIADKQEIMGPKSIELQTEEEEEDDENDEEGFEDDEVGASQDVVGNGNAVKMRPVSTTKSSGAYDRSSTSSTAGRKGKYLESDVAEVESIFPDGGIVEIVEQEDQKPSTSRRSEPAGNRGFFDTLRYQTHRTLGLKYASHGVVKDTTSDIEHTKPLTDRKDQQVVDGSLVKLPNKHAQGSLNNQSRDNYDAALSDRFFSPKSFKAVGASEEMVRSLQKLNVKRPSEIQAMAYMPILEGESCIMADQTGSGKTLAYLAPLIQCLHQKEKIVGKSAPKRPRVVILVPTNELANQVLNVCRTISRSGVPFRSLLITGGFKRKTQVEGLEQGVDIVVATPGRFLQLLEAGTVQLDDLRSLAVDEADILYEDEEFSQTLRTIKQSSSSQVQYIHVTATLPVDVHKRLMEMYPDCISLIGPSLHQTAIGLQEILVNCSEAEGNEKTPETAFLAKKIALLQLVEQRPVSKTIIFCNKIETCRKVENALHRFDRTGTKLLILPYHAALAQEARAKSLEQFLGSKPDKPTVLVCTDRASRGLDSIDVEHVVLFDFPRDPSEYVRRVGRTARGAGGTGKAYVFVVGKQVSLARRIMARNEKGHPIHSVPSPAF